MRYYKISEEDLIDLLEASMILNALISGGVDNWEWYSESYNECLDAICEESNWDYEDFRKVAIDDVASFELIVETE